MSAEPNGRDTLRRRLTVELTASAFDAFCLDKFEQVFHQFTAGMDRTARVTLLFAHVRDDAAIAWALDAFLMKGSSSKRTARRFFRPGVLALVLMPMMLLAMLARTTLQSTALPTAHKPSVVATPPPLEKLPPHPPNIPQESSRNPIKTIVPTSPRRSEACKRYRRAIEFREEQPSSTWPAEELESLRQKTGLDEAALNRRCTPT